MARSGARPVVLTHPAGDIAGSGANPRGAGIPKSSTGRTETRTPGAIAFTTGSEWDRRPRWVSPAWARESRVNESEFRERGREVHQTHPAGNAGAWAGPRIRRPAAPHHKEHGPVRRPRSGERNTAGPVGGAGRWMGGLMGRVDGFGGRVRWMGPGGGLGGRVGRPAPPRAADGRRRTGLPQNAARARTAPPQNPAQARPEPRPEPRPDPPPPLARGQVAPRIPFLATGLSDPPARLFT